MKLIVAGIALMALLLSALAAWRLLGARGGGGRIGAIVVAVWLSVASAVLWALLEF